jgi:hypothetical protein
MNETPPVGEAGLGAYAREQIHRHCRDPRLDRDRGAAIADFWDATEEAERLLTLGILGLHELRHTLERHERELGAQHTDAALDFNTRSSLQAAWERSESARIEIGHGYPHLYAQALLSLNSALDAMVEDLSNTWRGFRVKPAVEHLMARASEEVPDALTSLSPEAVSAITEVLTTTVAEKALGKAERLHGSGVDRYERVLVQLGLAAPADRPLPSDLVEALTEISAIRNVLVHRAGRIDLRALGEAPTLHPRYKLGNLVRLLRSDYQRYSAAIRCYAAEISFRGIRNWPEVSDADAPDLASWQNYRLLGV